MTAAITPTGRRSYGTGLRQRHSRACAVQDGGACDCQPSYEAFVYDVSEDRKIRRTFASADEAMKWRVQTMQDMSGRDGASPALRAAWNLRCAATALYEMLASEHEPVRVAARAALEAIYAAEDAAALVVQRDG